MQRDALLVLTIIAALGAALNGGIFFAFSTFVMGALRRLPPTQGLAAMQEINITAVTPPFVLALFGTAVVSLAAAVVALIGWNGAASAIVLAGAAVYATGSIAVTAAYNVSRNNDLATLARSRRMPPHAGVATTRSGQRATTSALSPAWLRPRCSSWRHASISRETRSS